MAVNNFGIYEWISYILVLVGGINWGLVGLFKFNLVEVILGGGFLARLVYILVGVGAGYLIYNYFMKKRAA
jgi:uncharacterized membrane protein YuzA (DUF378 family)